MPNFLTLVKLRRPVPGTTSYINPNYLSILGDRDRTQCFRPLGPDGDISEDQPIVLSILTIHRVHPDFDFHRFPAC